MKENNLLSDNLNRNGVIDHVGIAVADIDVALAYYADTLGLEIIHDEISDGPGVRLVYLGDGEAKLQLVRATRPGPVADFVSKTGGGLHHVCFRVTSIPEVLHRLQQEQKIVAGGMGANTCFLSANQHGVHVELTEWPE